MGRSNTITLTMQPQESFQALFLETLLASDWRLAEYDGRYSAYFSRDREEPEWVDFADVAGLREALDEHLRRWKQVLGVK